MNQSTWIAVLSLSLFPYAVEAASPRVDWEVVQAQSGPIDASQRWLAFLGKTSPNLLRIRAPRPGDRPRVETLPSADHFRVTALLTRQNQLRVPGRTFRLGDQAGIQSWLDGLPAQIAEQADPAKAPAAFGLTSRQLVDVAETMSVSVRVQTASRPTGTVVRELLRDLPVRTSIDASARARLGQGSIVRDQLQGMAVGTALAAVLRPLDLAFVPSVDAAGRVSLRIALARGLPDVWPVGWPVEGAATATLPVLLEKLPVEIVDMPLTRVLDALQPRVGVPFLLDHKTLAELKIRPDEIKVAFAAKKTFYKRVLDRVLFKARLELEVRVDDGDAPFLWIRPVRRAR